jgi:RNA polymerase-binding transcription factor DksA
MLQERDAQPAASAAVPPAGGLRWRALLEDRWKARLRDVTELSLAYCRAADVIADGQDAAGDRPEAQRLLRLTVAARRKLADTEEALGRLAAGTFGRCEQCRSALPPRVLAVIPETRYCPSCAAGPAAAMNR